MSVVEENWQTTRPTIIERNKFMFNNDLFSDVKFVVRKTDGESESKQVIPAHKFVLSISSPVFEAMFYGDLAESGDSIELPDCEYDNLLELFRYMYSDEVQLSGSNVMGVLYLAKKYIVPSLADKCTEYLQDNLDSSNVFSILPSARKYDEKNLVDQSWKVIDKQTEEAVKSDGFATIERSLLEALVVRDTLTIEEIELFKAVDLWATKKCERQGLEEDGKVKRTILGEQIIKGIRFPTMKLEDFSSVVLLSDILTKNEIASIVKSLGSPASSPVEFSATKRRGFQFYGDLQRCCRFGSLFNSVWTDSSSNVDAISFSVDKDIVLHGVCLCGSGSNIYFVQLDIMDSKSKLISVSKTGQFTSELLQGENCNYYGFKVIFDKKKIVLKKNTKYDIRAKILASVPCFGVNGVRSVQCSGVAFSFMDSKYSTTETGVTQGQFPELLFSL
ncbi:BTB/POZ domain-containing protein 6-like [Oculina patagonica]